MSTDLDPAAQGSPLSLEVETIEQCADGLRRFIYGKSRSPQDVEDVAQEVWRRFLEMDTQEAIREPLAMLFTIAKSVLIDRGRKVSRYRRHICEATEADVNIASEKLEDRIEEDLSIRQRVEQILTEIPPIHASALILHKRDGYSQEEVATKLGVRPATVKKYLSAALAQIRKKYRE